MCIIGVYTNEQKDPGFQTTRWAIEELKSRGIEYYIDDQFAGHIDPSRSIADKKIDYLLVFGGDGTMLSAARKYAPKDVAILGFNMGRLGFLLDTEISEFNAAIDAIVSGDFKIESRLMLLVEVTDKNKNVKKREYALNEAVISQRHIL